MKLKRYRYHHGTDEAKRIGLLCDPSLFADFKKQCKAEKTLISDKIRNLMATYIEDTKRDD